MGHGGTMPGCWVHVCQSSHMPGCWVDVATAAQRFIFSESLDCP